MVVWLRRGELRRVSQRSAQYGPWPFAGRWFSGTFPGRGALDQNPQSDLAIKEQGMAIGRGCGRFTKFLDDLCDPDAESGNWLVFRPLFCVFLHYAIGIF